MPVLDPNAANVRVFYLLEMDALFRELIRHPAALALVRSLLGPDVMVSNFTTNIARPGARFIRISRWSCPNHGSNPGRSTSSGA